MTDLSGFNFKTHHYRFYAQLLSWRELYRMGPSRRQTTHRLGKRTPAVACTNSYRWTFGAGEKSRSRRSLTHSPVADAGLSPFHVVPDWGGADGGRKWFECATAGGASLSDVPMPAVWFAVRRLAGDYARFSLLSLSHGRLCNRVILCHSSLFFFSF